MRYEILCHDCHDTSQSDWFGKAVSDANWHNTGTGHDAYVTETATGAIEFDYAWIEA
jgi:hypothetical protein